MSESATPDNSSFRVQIKVLQLFWFWLTIFIGAASLWLVSLHYANEWLAHFRDLSFALFAILGGFLVTILTLVRRGWKQVEQLNFLVQTLPIVIMLCLLILDQDSWLEQVVSEIPPVPTGLWIFGILSVLVLWNLYLGAFDLVRAVWQCGTQILDVGLGDWITDKFERALTRIMNR